jgi:hypothetical protein
MHSRGFLDRNKEKKTKKKSGFNFGVDKFPNVEKYIDCMKARAEDIRPGMVIKSPTEGANPVLVILDVQRIGRLIRFRTTHPLRTVREVLTTEIGVSDQEEILRIA